MSYFKFRINEEYLKTFFKDKDENYNKSNNKFKSKNRHINWDQKIFNTIDFLSKNNDSSIELKDINKLVKKRNDIIHANSTTGAVIKIEITEICQLFEIITKNIEKIK